jgi:hypothetical protein
VHVEVGVVGGVCISVVLKIVQLKIRYIEAYIACSGALTAHGSPRLVALGSAHRENLSLERYLSATFHDLSAT